MPDSRQYTVRAGCCLIGRGIRHCDESSGELGKQNRDPSVVAVLVAVPSVHMCRTLQSIAVAMLNVSIDYKSDNLILAVLCNSMQNSYKRTHNPLVRGSNPCRPTSIFLESGAF